VTIDIVKLGCRLMSAFFENGILTDNQYLY